ncbi:MAG: SUMF1/EgtB/PvdO family nonheme iron enzyme [Cyanobacteria bacterium J06627_8]
MLTSNPFPSSSSDDHQISLQSLQSHRQSLRIAYEQCRRSTFDLISTVDQTNLCQQVHPDFSPIGWHVGHIAYTEALWILERLARQSPRFPQYHRLFAADGLPKAERQYLPDIQTLYDYLNSIRDAVFDYLDIAPVDQQQRIWWFLLQHESQHCETIALIMEVWRVSQHSIISGIENDSAELVKQTSAIESESELMCHVPAGHIRIGSDACDALDNEQPSHDIKLDEFWIDRYPVTCRDFQRFIDAGGYDDDRWWSADGWAWQQEHRVRCPLYWPQTSGHATHPVCGVSWYEASAYAEFVGKRLPTEAEWETAARWNPSCSTAYTYPWGNSLPTPQHCNYSHHVGSTSDVGSYPSGTSAVGCADMLGNVWEWTASTFDRYRGFKPFPYVGYSQAYFDGQHYVLKGGSWATRRWALRPSLRNWYHPWVRQIFAGFRCVSSTPHGS